MGPGCFYPGNNPGPANGHRVSDASMGPGCFYPGNLVDQDRVGVAPVASMGPGCFYPGNSPHELCAPLLGKLQWGRDVSIPEMRYRKWGGHQDTGLQWGRDVSIPEMDRLLRWALLRGLLQWGRDVSIPEICQVGVVLGFGQRASMGPGCFYPGNAFMYVYVDEPCWLQWGRDVSIPEMCRSSRMTTEGDPASMGPGCFYPGNTANWTRPIHRVWLQWGRDVSIPEMHMAAGGQGDLRSGFNGAGMFLSRKYGELDETDPSRLASMGPGCFYPGNAYGGGRARCS